jgi:hypothetical protein
MKEENTLYTPNVGDIKYKKEVVKKVSLLLKEDGITDLTGWVDSHSTERYKNNSGFVRSVAYWMERQCIAEVIPYDNWQRFMVKEIPWEKRHTFWHAVRINATNFVFSLAAGITIGLLIPRYVQKEDLNKTQTQLQTHYIIHDSLAILQGEINNIQNSLKKK